MDSMYGKTALKAYQKGPQYGKFNSLYGTGDHPSEGGKIVEGVEGKIHIQGGSKDGKFSRVEGDIMKAHPKEGEYILAQRNGYSSLAEVPVSEEGKRMYVSGLPTFGMPSWDRIQKAWGWGEYSEEAIAEEEIETRLGDFLKTGFESLQKGTDKMLGTDDEVGFIDKQLQEQLEEFGTRKEMLDTAAGRLDTQTAGIQQSMKQYGGTRDIQKKTGLVTGGPDFALEDIETQGEMQMSNIGAGRKDILSQRELIAGQERQATTQSEIDKYKYGTETSTAMAKMLSDYMAATGEDVPEEFYDMFTEYSEQYV